MYVPVKATLSTMGWLAIAAPAVGPYPGTMLTTPAGKPASFKGQLISKCPLVSSNQPKKQ